MKKIKENDIFIGSLIASLTLGLAPFFPEPHIWKQIMNIYLGRPMFRMDWVDIAIHGTPWLIFITFGIRRLAGMFKARMKIVRNDIEKEKK